MKRGWTWALPKCLEQRALEGSGQKTVGAGDKYRGGVGCAGHGDGGQGLRAAEEVRSADRGRGDGAKDTRQEQTADAEREGASHGRPLFESGDEALEPRGLPQPMTKTKALFARFTRLDAEQDAAGEVIEETGRRLFVTFEDEQSAQPLEVLRFRIHTTSNNRTGRPATAGGHKTAASGRCRYCSP